MPTVEQRATWNRTWLMKNPDYFKIYYQTHRDRHLAIGKDWAMRHKEQVAGYQAAWQQSNPERRAFTSAKYRCNNPKAPNYRLYGGRGIEMRYQSFEDFILDVGLRPSAKHSLDRINNAGHYEIGNCRWATKSQQASNRRDRSRKSD